MKTRLLRKAKKKVRMYERNGKYTVQVKGSLNYNDLDSRIFALNVYATNVVIQAKNIFGYKPKKRIR